MKTIPSYGKIFAVGSSGTENALVGDVVIQEKVDGSMFGFGLNEDGNITMRSKGKTFAIPDVDEAIPLVVEKMFLKAGESVFRFREELRKCLHDSYFYAEFLQSPKHNTLKYDHPPKNNLVLFDGMVNGRWVTREQLEYFASCFGIDVIPELYRGPATVDTIKTLLTTPSYLGEVILEGVVIKNYEQTILVGGHIFPLFTKYVREEFKELHTVDWKIRQPKDTLKDYVDGFANEARWQKAIIHSKEKGTLTNTLKDIGPLMDTVSKDIVEEEEQNIKNVLYKMFIKDILRAGSRGFPEWYKGKLLENLVEIPDDLPIEPVF